MSTLEVFRPSDAPLMIRSSLQEGMEMPFHRKNMMASRPHTSGSAAGHRFGRLSHNAFFTRHNPHPSRVSHIKGLLDIPICAVNDDGYLANPRYSMQLPPKQFAPQARPRDIPRIPVNAAHIGKSQLHPINTITGLQGWTGLQNFRERAVPQIGMVPVTQSWRDELRAFTELAMIPPPSPEKHTKPKTQETARVKTQYSTNTGRIIPPSSRNMTSRGRTGTRHKFRKQLEHIIEEGNMETVVLTMLCQILQVEDLNAVQAWLCAASDIEKNMALDLVRAAITAQASYVDIPAEYIDKPITPPENCDVSGTGNEEQDKFIEKLVERLSIADGHFSRQRVSRDENGDMQTTTVEPLPDIFKKPEPVTDACPELPATASNDKPHLRLVSRPTTQSMMVDEDKAWNPTDATV